MCGHPAVITEQKEHSVTATVDHPTEFSARLFGFADAGDVDGFLRQLADDIRL